jgi:hypothetical protein
MSIWSDIQDRSCGEKQREEDKNQLRYLSEKYKDFIDYRQYHRDLDDNFDLWGREDLITTHLGKGAKRRLKIKCMADVLAQMYPEYTDENEAYKWEPKRES